jgi:predicted dehydrogenase
MARVSRLRRAALAALATIVASTLVLSANVAPQQRTPAPAADAGRPIRIGLIGLDTSHAVAFTQLLNDASRPDHITGARVVAAFKGGSPDVESSASRVEQFTTELRDKWQIELVDSIDALVQRVDAVMLTSVDGRVHLAQARPVLAAHKPLFVDKPFAASVRDAVELARLARESNTPIFSSSSLRFADDVQAMKRDPRAAEVMGALAWGPATLEPHHPDMFWYGIHTIEILYTFMGPGCEQVSRTHTAGSDAIVGRWKDGRIGIVRGGRDTATTYGQVVFGKKEVVTAPPRSADAGAGAGAAAKKSMYYGIVREAVEFFRTGKSPVPIEETLEIMAFMEAADLSKARNGAPVALTEVLPPR